MSILLSTVFPLALSGLGLEAASAAPAAKPTHLQASTARLSAPAIAAAKGDQPKLVPIQAPAPEAPSPQAAPAPDRNAIIDRVSRALTEVKTAQGTFTQADESGGVSSGRFYISRPGKVRFEYDTPEPMFIVSDGVSVSIEEPRRDSYDAVPLSSTPLSLFLRSNVDLKRDGGITKVTSSNGSHFVTLVDKTGEADGEMTLEFRASDFELLGWRQIDGSGAQTRVRLSDVKKNAPVKASLFVVKAPDDEERR